MADQPRKDINRAMSMAEAAPMLSTTPRGALGSAFQEETSFDSRGGAKGASGSAAAGAASVSSSSSRKPGRYVSADKAVFPCLMCGTCSVDRCNSSIIAPATPSPLLVLGHTGGSAAKSNVGLVCVILAASVLRRNVTTVQL